MDKYDSKYFLENKEIVIGTRASKLAIYQANLVRSILMKKFPNLTSKSLIKIKTIKTKGDIIQDKELAQIGGKGLFTKEIENKLLDKTIDIAVHSLKDMPARIIKGLSIVAVLARDNDNDYFISNKYHKLSDMPAGAIIGTSSARRKAIINYNSNHKYKIVSLRGNIDQRLYKLDKNIVDGAIMASCALERNKVKGYLGEKLSKDYMLPSAAQGVIAMEAREDDVFINNLLGQINDPISFLYSTGEREFFSRVKNRMQNSSSHKYNL